MMQLKKLLVYSLFCASALLILVQLVEATAMSFTVHKGEEVDKQINLAVEDHVVIKFTVLGQTLHALNFSIIHPNGTVQNFGTVGTFNYPFVCSDSGEYILRFSNVGYSEDKFVTLNYEVEHYIFGISQMFFLTLIIAVTCVAGVAVFILMGKSH